VFYIGRWFCLVSALTGRLTMLENVRLTQKCLTFKNALAYFIQW
jgi:hypothetical protein